MQSFETAGLMAEQIQTGQAWLEFLRVPSLSMGVYHLQAGQEDRQQPHSEDEVYYIVAGRGKFQAGERVQDVGPGMILFVERFAEHHFLDITEDLTALVLFAPPEGSLQQAAKARSPNSG